MAHTIKVIGGGFGLLIFCLLIGRWLGGAEGLATAGKVFIPIWLFGAGINMWVGVSKAGYSVAEEAPILVLVFAVPAAAALGVLWWLSRSR